MPKPVDSVREKGSLHVTGYQIIRHALDVDERVLASVQEACGKKAEIIFNHNETNTRNDRKRRQRDLPLKLPFMRQFDESVRQIIHTTVNTALIPTDPVILHSRPGCQPQAAHCDYVPDKGLKAASDDQMPLAALICLMPNTRLKIWPKSARLAMKDSGDLKKVAPIIGQEVELTPGDMIVFRGDFVHAGSGYEADNYRIHYYLDSPLIPRTANRTWLIEKHGNDELRRIIQPGLPSLEKQPVVGSAKKKASDHSVVSFFSQSQRLVRKRRLDQETEEPSSEQESNILTAKKRTPERARGNETNS